MTDEDNCYICLTDSSEESFINPSPCKCKGSIKIHKSCLESVRKNSPRCGICKCEYNIENEFIEYHNNGSIKAIHNLQNGKVNGISIYYFLDGTVSFESTYVDGVLNGTVKGYYHRKNTTQKLLQCIINYIDGKKIDYKEYFENGRLIVEDFYDSDENIKTHKTYHLNGILAAECNYIKGKAHGIYKEYHYDGNLKTECNYVKGLLDGPVKKYYENGEISYEASYSYGKLDKSLKTYYRSGKVECEEFYFRDIPRGIHKKYNIKGEIVSQINHEKKFLKEILKV
jgi:antitoxin component YwqK of YwqJK toxin-antitoxin module